MPRVEHPIARDYPRLPILIGPDGALTAFFLEQGLLPPSPVRVEAVIDTGATVSSATADLLRRVRAPKRGAGESQTAGGPVEVDLFSISLGILLTGEVASVVVSETLVVGEMGVPIPEVDFLLGMDVLRKCRLTLDGPAGTFALEV